MLFPQNLHEGIRSGRIRRTYRAWDRPRAKVGARHRLGTSGAIVIEAVEAVGWRDVGDEDAKGAGLASRDELRRVLLRHTDLTASTMLYCVTFRYEEGDDPRSQLAAEAAMSPEERRAVAAKLARMDERSPTGPWTGEVLRLIAEHPRRRAGDLAEMIDRERLDFKKDVRKLKALGLTISHEVGYEISPRGRAYMAGES
jgi:hypothetical protein